MCLEGFFKLRRVGEKKEDWVGIKDGRAASSWRKGRGRIATSGNNCSGVLGNSGY